MFSGNTAHYSGGGIHCSGVRATITNNVIHGNSSDYIGGGITCAYCNPLIRNNTITRNFTVEAGGIYCWDSSPRILNSICWADSASGQVSEISVNEGSQPNVTYCDVQGGWEGDGNIDIDPLFRHPEDGDFHLMSTACGDLFDSPCIDAGDPSIFDYFLDCNWGLGTERSDMGAYGGQAIPTDIIEEGNTRIPSEHLLSQNYPNPFNATTTIKYNLPKASEVIIDIYNILGRKVETLVQREQPAGYHRIISNAKDQSSGIYFYRIQAGEYAETRKMVLLK